MNKRIISAIIFLLALVNQVSAEDKVTISDFVISAGETKELSITLVDGTTVGTREDGKDYIQIVGLNAQT